MIKEIALLCFLSSGTSIFTDGLVAPEMKYPNMPEGRAVWSNCRGKRLDSLSFTNYLTPKECIELGGDCCGVNDDGIGNGSESPYVMLPNGKCFSCYNSKIKAKCTGNLIRSQVGFHQDWWVNSKNCIKVGGSCCDGRNTSTNPAVFDPNEYPDADFCLNCFSGPTSNETTSCTGQLLANNDYSARACIFFGGICCDDEPNIGGTAFSAYSFPDAKCISCFDGEPSDVDGVVTLATLAP